MRHKLTQIEGMNKLVENFIISDNCVLVCDVASDDCDRAVKWLDANCPIP